MNFRKVWLIIMREFLSHVKKKSFLVTTVLVPLIFPLLFGIMGWLMVRDIQGAKQETVLVLDESGIIHLKNSKRFQYQSVTGTLEDAKRQYRNSDGFGLLYIPPAILENTRGTTLYTLKNQSLEKTEILTRELKQQIEDIKLTQHHLDEKTIEALRPNLTLRQINLNTQDDEEKANSSGILYAIGFTLGILIYMFVLIYGIQIMQGVIDEKSSKVVEIIVSSVKPFELMLGKIVGIASVGLVQFLIWFILIFGLSSSVLGYFGVKMSKQNNMETVMKQSMGDEAQEQANSKAEEIMGQISQIPFMKIAAVFIFYFLGGYLLYGALFAAVGSAIDSIQESQQFQFPITVPLLIGYMSLFMFVLRDPHGSVSFWLSIIPFTSPVTMVGRVAFDVPLWQLLLSMSLLIGGFIFTTWIAGRIYRVGILMSGAKVNFKILMKWFWLKE